MCSSSGQNRILYHTTKISLSIGLFSLFNFSHLRLTVFWFLFRCCLHLNSIWAQKIDLSKDKPIYSSFALKPFTHRDYTFHLYLYCIFWALFVYCDFLFPLFREHNYVTSFHIHMYLRMQFVPIVHMQF